MSDTTDPTERATYYVQGTAVALDALEAFMDERGIDVLRADDR